MSPPPHTHTPTAATTHISSRLSWCASTRTYELLSQLLFLWKSTFHLICLHFFFCLKKFAVPEGVGVGGRGGVTNRPGGWPAWCRAANLRTFSLQSLFKESEMLLISFYRFHLSPVSPSSFSLLTTRFLLLFTPCCFTFFLSRHSSLVQWKSRTVYCSFLFVSPLRVTVIC